MKRSHIAVAGLAAALAVMAVAQDSGGTATSQGDTQGMLLLTRVQGDRTEVLHVSPTENLQWAGYRIRKSPGGGESVPSPVNLSVLDAQGNVLGPGPDLALSPDFTHFDVADPKTGTLEGGLRAAPDDVRVLALPTPAAAAFVRSGSGAQLPIRPPRRTCPACVEAPVLLYPAAAKKPSGTFDIVILGDGFTADQRDAFLEKARELSRGLLGMVPFRDLADRIQVHAIPAVSRQAGIDNYPDKGVRKDTCYDMTGFWDGGDYAGFVGTPEPQRIWDAVACHFPLSQIELKVMLVNIPIYGGRGDYETRTAYAAMYADGGTEGFVELAAHEIGHAIAGLADEYMGCEPVPGDKPAYPNVAGREEVEAGTVPWLPLARPDEKTATGGFMYYETLEDDPSLTCTTDPDALAARFAGKLGLFWGAQYVDPGPDPCQGGCSPYGDPRGANWFRPMATCRMRNILDDFCRACAAEIAKAITAATPRPRQRR